MNNSEIVDIIAKELGYNRFSGTIAAKNSNKKLNSQEECELANVLASNNLSLFKDDALLLLAKIINNVFIEHNSCSCCLVCNRIILLKKYIEEEIVKSPSLKNINEQDIRKFTDSDYNVNEIDNPILNLEI